MIKRHKSRAKRRLQ